MRKIFKSRLSGTIVCTVFAAFVFIGTPITGMAYTTATGIVSADAAKVRKEPTTASDSLAGLLKGSTVTVIDEVTDSAGAVWYKVTVDNNTGYIRSDLLIKANSPTGTAAGGTAATENAGNLTVGSEKKPEPTTATPIAETKAYVNFDSARIREGASVDHGIVGSATKNTAVTITGEAKANDGKKWYQIKYTTSAGREVVGFIRSDLLTLGDPPVEAPAEPPAEEETPAEESPEEGEGTEGEAAEGEEPEAPAEEPAEVPEEPQEVTKPDYEMVYTTNSEGVNEWYLYDNINGTRQTLAGLRAAAEAGTAQSEIDTSEMSTQKIIIIVLAVVAAILAVAVTLLLFKIRDLYDSEYDDEEDDDDEEEEDEEEDDDEEEEEEVPVSKRIKAVKPVGEPREKAVSPVAVRQRPDSRQDIQEERAENIKPAPQPKRKAKNFLIDDDEFEFEFLNMEDKD